MSSPTPIFISSNLEYTLRENGLSPEDYLPAYGGESAGLDLYYVGDQPFHIPPSKLGHKILIPTGLHVALPKTRVVLLQERSSISKTPLKLRAGVIDAGYTGEIFCNCINISDSAWNINPHEKLPFQLLVLPVFNEFNPLSSDEWAEVQSRSLRGTAMLGSSDKSSS